MSPVVAEGAALAVRAEGLTRDFGAVRALDELTLEVPAGTIFGFLGPNGAGKTTTIQLLLGLLEPTSGGAQVLGFDIRTQGAEVRARTGALLEHTGIYEQLTAEENLEFYARVARLDPARRRARIRELLDRMGLWERRGDRAGTWSRGMKQRLALARALLHAPPLVFLDEPTAGLDVVAANAVRDELAVLSAETGTTVFLTTHNMAEAERLCGTVAVIRAGRLLAVGHPDELRRRRGVEVEVVGGGFGEELLGRLRAQPGVASVALVNGRLVLGLDADTDVTPLLGLMLASGARVEEVRRGRASLEDAFLDLMSTEDEPC